MAANDEDKILTLLRTIDIQMLSLMDMGEFYKWCETNEVRDAFREAQRLVSNLRAGRAIDLKKMELLDEEYGEKEEGST